MLKRTRAQSLGEYVLVITIVVAAVVAMVPMVRRGTQSLIKAGADQLGDQKNAEQEFNGESGFTNFVFTTSNSYAQTDKTDTMNATVWYKGITVYEQTNSTTNSLTNMGFTPQP